LFWNDLVFVGVCQAQNSEVVPVKQDRRAVRATWVSSFTLVALVLLLLITGDVSASNARSRPLCSGDLLTRRRIPVLDPGISTQRKMSPPHLLNVEQVCF
jgi:hypothetical protein